MILGENLKSEEEILDIVTILKSHNPMRAETGQRKNLLRWANCAIVLGLKKSYL